MLIFSSAYCGTQSGKDSGPSTWGRKDKSRVAISSLKGRFVRLELGVANTKEGMDFLEQSMEKAVEDLKVQIQDHQEGCKARRFMRCHTRSS